MIWKLTRPLRVIRFRWRKWRGTLTGYQQTAHVFDVPYKMVGQTMGAYRLATEVNDSMTRQIVEYQRELEVAALKKYREKTGSLNMIG